MMKRQLFILLMLLLAISQTHCAHMHQAEAASLLDSALIWKARFGDYQGAIALCDQAIDLDSKFARAYCDRGRYKASISSHYDDAINDFDQAIALNPKDTNAFALRGEVKVLLGRYADAIVDCNKAIVLDAKYTNAYNTRGYAYYKLGGTKVNYQKSILDYDKSIQLGGTNYEPSFEYRDSIVAALHTAGDKSYAKTLQIPDLQTATLWLKKAFEKIKNKDYEGAIHDFTEAISLDPKLASAYHNRGFVEGHLGQYANAIADFKQAIALDPNNKAGYYNRGIIEDKLGHYADEIADYNQAIALDPKFADAYSWRSIAKVDLGHYADAIADCDQAIALEPKEFSAYNCRGYAYFKVGNSKANYQKAIADYDMAVQLGGNIYKPHFKYRHEAVAAKDKL